MGDQVSVELILSASSSNRATQGMIVAWENYVGGVGNWM